MAITDQITGATTPSTGLDHFLARTNNLDDLQSVSTARTNLGLTALATTTPASGIATFLATPTSANLAAAVTDEEGSGSLVFRVSPYIITPTFYKVTIDAGSATDWQLKFTSSTLLTTPAAGVKEYNDVFYSTPDASNRGVDLSEHFVILTSSNTLTSQTGAQPIFDGGGGPANGAITLAVGTYFFECQFALTTMNTSSGSWGFALGGTATKTEGWVAHTSRPATSLATAENEGMLTFNSAANTAWGAASTDAQGVAHVSGVIRVTVAGTIIPQVSLGVANAAVVQANSFFRIRKIGSSSVATVGNWS